MLPAVFFREVYYRLESLLFNAYIEITPNVASNSVKICPLERICIPLLCPEDVKWYYGNNGVPNDQPGDGKFFSWDMDHLVTFECRAKSLLDRIRHSYLNFDLEMDSDDDSSNSVSNFDSIPPTKLPKIVEEV